MSYYLEDGTLQLSEPSVQNSGLQQGIFLHRHKVSKPNGGFVGPTDLRCGHDLVLYSRTYRINSLDEFTRRFYEMSGLDVGEETEVPRDPFSDRKLKEVEDDHKPLPADVIRAKTLVNVLCGGFELNRKVKQYLEKDGKILRFYCYWDDTSEDGFRHFFHLHYFLANDTVEIIEVFPETVSCASTRSVFLKRGLLRKEKLGPVLSDDDSPLVCLEDLTYGSVRISNREIQIYDCDPFTRNYIADNMGIDFTTRPLEKKEKTVLALPVPPPIGFGTEEDTLASCDRTRIVPRKLKLDPTKLEHSGVILRFEGIMSNPKSNDEGRQFIVGFYPSDSSIAVWEIPVRNSGIIGGKFAERGTKRSPASGRPYKLEDIGVGKQVTISGVEFSLLSADAFTTEWLNNRVHA